VDLRQRRELNNGFGDTLSRAFELVITPMVFGFLGFLLDGKLGSRPLFMLVLFFVALGYLVWKMVRGYDADMSAQEAGKPWTRAR
jgi:F0F1-type ATP synthase assembly protein I